MWPFAESSLTLDLGYFLQYQFKIPGSPKENKEQSHKTFTITLLGTEMAHDPGPF